VSGALAERVFAHKLDRVGFVDLTIHARLPFGLDDAARYPLFTPDLIELMRTLIPAADQGAVAVAVTLSAYKPDAAPTRAQRP
jgi:arsenite methyltransferase